MAKKKTTDTKIDLQSDMGIVIIIQCVLAFNRFHRNKRTLLYFKIVFLHHLYSHDYFSFVPASYNRVKFNHYVNTTKLLENTILYYNKFLVS